MLDIESYVSRFTLHACLRIDQFDREAEDLVSELVPILVRERATPNLVPASGREVVRSLPGVAWATLMKGASILIPIITL
jgi:hypothetical protein